MSRVPLTPWSVRAARPGDIAFLWEMLYDAAIVAPEIRALSNAEALSLPVITRYLTGWGRPGDAGVVAEGLDRIPLGAAWYRLYGVDERGDGIVAWPGTPELSIGVRPDARGQGIGRALMTALIAVARARGYARLVLSVDPGNPAARLYQRCGFSELPACDPARGTSLLMGLDVGAPEPR